MLAYECTLIEQCVFRIRSSGGVVIANIGDSLTNADGNPDVGIRGLQFSSNSSQVNRISFIHSNTVIPFDFQYNSPKGKNWSDFWNQVRQ